MKIVFLLNNCWKLRVANRDRIHQGNTYDTDLSPLGVQQAKILFESKKLPINPLIFSSPLLRARQTAVLATGHTEEDFDIRIRDTNH